MSAKKDFFKKFKRFLFAEKLIERYDKIIIGISGGIDSVLTLYLLKIITAEHNLTTLAVHINYNLRGNESQENEKFVRQLCRKWGIPLVVRNVHIPDRSDLENRARQIRFDVFYELLRKFDFNKIALGHNKNDQAETFLLHLVRGCGITGMKGMLPIENQIIRPLLDFTRDEIEKFAIDKGIEFSQDSSNFSMEFDRNKIRHRILPLFQELFNSGVTSRIAESMKIYQQTEEYLQNHTEEIFHKIVEKKDKNSFTVAIRSVKNIGVLQFYIFRKIFGALSGSEKNFYHVHYSAIIDLLQSSESKYIQLPQEIFVIKNSSALTFSKEPPETWKNRREHIINYFAQRFVYGKYYLAMSKIKTFRYHKFDFSKENTGFVDFHKIKFPLIVRTRRKGDRFFPLGMEHPKKIKNYFIDLKIPRYERDKKIIIADQNKIIWVCGYQIDDRVKVTPATKQILVMKLISEQYHSRKAGRTSEPVK
ncbi:MAG: tRNA lysidine(34) synthetase TilS [Candidatus Cloacimonadota bacterium]|nr:tRNA lysidine(34) synthetase TilS [Candidatus Cloacimonadota bacterium]